MGGVVGDLGRPRDRSANLRTCGQSQELGDCYNSCNAVEVQAIEMGRHVL